MDSSEKWYSVKEVADRYRVSRDTITRRIKARKLRAMKLPSLSSKRKRIYETHLVSASELERFERTNMTF
jgi:excisionase family DNA binding protein